MKVTLHGEQQKVHHVMHCMTVHHIMHLAYSVTILACVDSPYSYTVYEL